MPARFRKMRGKIKILRMILGMSTMILKNKTMKI